MTYSACAYKFVRGSEEGKITKAITKAPVIFGYMELCQNQERAVYAFVRGSNDGLRVCMLVTHALKTTCHTHVHCDNYIPAYPANPSKVTHRSQP